MGRSRWRASARAPVRRGVPELRGRQVLERPPQPHGRRKIPRERQRDNAVHAARLHKATLHLERRASDSRGRCGDVEHLDPRGHALVAIAAEVEATRPARGRIADHRQDVPVQEHAARQPAQRDALHPGGPRGRPRVDDVKPAVRTEHVQEPPVRLDRVRLVDALDLHVRHRVRRGARLRAEGVALVDDADVLRPHASPEVGSHEALRPTAGDGLAEDVAARGTLQPRRVRHRSARAHRRVRASTRAHPTGQPGDSHDPHPSSPEGDAPPLRET